MTNEERKAAAFEAYKAIETEAHAKFKETTAAAWTAYQKKLEQIDAAEEAKADAQRKRDEAAAALEARYEAELAEIEQGIS